MQYNTLEELEAYFKQEIRKVSEKELEEVRREIEKIKNKVVTELEETAKLNAKIIVDQELKEIDSDHAISLSRLADDNNRRLMAKRQELTEGLFADVRNKLLAYAATDDYKTMMGEKTRKLAQRFRADAVLIVGKRDESLLPELLRSFSEGTQGTVDPQIELGGFRLEVKKDRIIVDETFDSTLNEEREKFYANSNLIIG
ncbi:V-type ATP synthase subunit E [Proteiniclasticum sp. BAD-10]|jgi:vacuolar-type H+-ATPase subunit E/Vma4|uniref:V-type ATP synthase subunit E n=1 Tax=Proteiniclasticum sediminis TaxID=2804028 RepID=A0A941CNV4_9CLOT|nr:V-type ATP synthase subunit E [Proteiniclasticum sediminis]MBR0575349.1 V-type ATP synthase subunit E [Proteiniclasticum sediminis]